MSRSYKKPFVWISRRFDKLKRRAWRHWHKQKLSEFKFDPDADWDEAQRSEKEFSEWGTRCGWNIEPDENDDTWMIDSYEKMRRK